MANELSKLTTASTYDGQKTFKHCSLNKPTSWARFRHGYHGHMLSRV